MFDYKQLQNGSDIRGVAMEGSERVNLTPEAAKRIGSAFVLWLEKKAGRKSPRISCGRDSRLSGPALAEAFTEGALSAGADVTDFGLCSTPAMFMSTVTEGYMYDGSAMITASHLPPNRNGLKFFTRSGGLEKADITEILTMAGSGIFPKAARGNRDQADFLSVYAEQLTKKIKKEVAAPDYDHPLKGFHIVVDAGNGAGGFFVEKVLLPLGADTSGSLYLEPDGNFPNHTPNPEDEHAMGFIVKAVKENRADFGILFDTDVDRAGAVAPDGRELNKNRLIALVSALILEEHPGTIIVTDSITSRGLAEFIKQKGGIHHRFKRGYRNVINESIRLNSEGRDSQIAIETSGHAALLENYFLDDGAYLITKILIKLAKSRNSGEDLFKILDDLKEPAESYEFRMNIGTPDFKAYGNRIIKLLTAYAAGRDGWDIAPDNHEGIRVSFKRGDGDGWFLLRLSLHDPLMPLNIESDSIGGSRIIAKKLVEFLVQFSELDISKLERFAHYDDES